MAKRRVEIEEQFALTLLHEHALAVTAFNTASEENNRKNGVIYQALQSTSPIVNAITDLQQDGTRTLKDSIKLTYSGTAPNRVITVSFGSLLTQAQKNTIGGIMSVSLAYLLRFYIHIRF